MAGMKAMFALLLIAASPAQAAPLTVRMGESYVFTIKDGHPANARKVPSNAKPGKGQISVSVKPLGGTSMFMTNNSPVAYTFRAEILQGGKAVNARPCTLPANGRPIFEQWQQKADAVRIGSFKPANADGRC
jgi:hypothetical protein